MARLPAGLSDEELTKKRANIEAGDERKKAHTFRPAVAGFDLTFSPSKDGSVSTAWALADQGTKAVVYECHRRAIGAGHLEIRRGARVSTPDQGTNGIMQEDIDGIVAASFTHYDSRAGDPQLHDHVVVWNHAEVEVGRPVGRTLEGRRSSTSSIVTLSELHQGILTDILTEALGFGWEQTRTRNGMRKHEIVGVPDALIREFSQRRATMDQREDELVPGVFRARRRPGSPVPSRRSAAIAQQANLGNAQGEAALQPTRR